MKRFKINLSRPLEALVISAVAVTALRADPQVGPQVRVDAGNPTLPSNETCIISGEFDPLGMVGTWNDYRLGSARLGVGLSPDGGATWSDQVIRPPAPYQTTTEGDPMTAYDNRTGTLWVGAIAFGSNGGVFVARKPEDQPAFESAVMAEVTGGADKGWMAAGPAPGDPDATRLYMAYNEGLLISTDMGDTWSGPFSLGGGLGFLPRVGPNGELYIAYWNWSVGDEMSLIRSFDGGNTLSSPLTIASLMDVWGLDDTRTPGQYRVAQLAGLAVDPNDGTLYCVYPDTTEVVGGNFNVDVYFTVSMDQGSTWSTPVVINQDADPPGDQFFPWIEVDTAGRLHLVFYDTRNRDQDDSDSYGTIEAYYAYSDDAGRNWTEVVLTPAPFDSSLDGFGGVFIGDYLGLAVGANRSYPLYMSTQNGMADIFVHTIIEPMIGDFDSDGDVDLSDFATFALCYAGAAVTTPPPSCTPQEFAETDLDGDGDVDLSDFATFALHYGS